MNQPIFYNKTINKKELKAIIHSTVESYGILQATNLVENLKKSGFYFATKAGISISVEDLKVPPSKDPLFFQNKEEIKLAYFYEKRGNINEIERFQKVIDMWYNTSDLLKNQLVDFLKTVDPLNPVYMMAFSGARGNLSQVRQLVGMRGLMADPNGQIIDLPIKANFREGLTITDYVISSYGARKGIVDTALKTADSGYLTRRLVDVAQHVIIRELDCKTKNGIRLNYQKENHKIEKLVGRVIAKAIKSPTTNEILIDAGTTLTPKALIKLDFSADIILRSPLICESSHSICQKCYGWNLAQNKLVELADAIGVIAAQSIGEPGTQLTMRTFHTGGVFTGESSNQVRSASSGQVLFDKNLKTTIARTIYGEIILKAENNSQLFVLTEAQKLLIIKVTPEMLIFVQNQSEVAKGDLIAEIPSNNKQTTKEIKNVVSSVSGEVQFQNLNTAHIDSLTTNGLLWIATGQVYDIYPNMSIKRTGQIVLKNNAFAQTKILTPLNGFIKYTNRGENLDISLISDFALFSYNQLFKYQEKTVLKLTANCLFTLVPNNEQKFQPHRTLAQLLTKKYYLPLPYHVFKPKKEKNDYIIKPIYPHSFFSNTSNLIFETSTNLDEDFWDKKILFPGEIVNESIQITRLCCCEILKIGNLQLTIRLNPLTNFIVSLPSKTAITKVKRNLDLLNNTLGFITLENSDEGALYDADKPFVSTYIGFNENTNIVGFRSAKKTLTFDKLQQSFISYALIYQFPITFNQSSQNVSQITTNYFVNQNQYIEQYSIIATISNTVTQKIKIRNVKNLQQRPSRLLISTSKNYKNYTVPAHSQIRTSQFIVIDDKVNQNEFAGYSGYNTSSVANSSDLEIRISVPFFISIGTRIFVQHGSLVKKEESLCQLLYNRVISDDIISGLPRVEKLFEARIDKNKGVLIENPGIVKTKQEKEGKISILEKQNLKTYNLNEQDTQILLKKGEIVFVGQPINVNMVNPHTVLSIYFKYYCSFYTAQRATLLSVTNIQILLLNLVQEVYQSQGVEIADKHIEIIIRQITSKVKVLRFNIDTFFIPTEFMEFDQVNYINKSLKLVNKPLIEYQPILLGITKVSLMTESFVSAASFQETTRILAQAAVEGRIEWLRGLKENVILGRLIPAGTGFKSFNSTSLLNVRLNT